MRLDLLRHGETTLSHTLRGHTDDELTENGWLQMQSTIQQYVAGGTNWDVIFSSPLQRCHVFAINLAEQLEIHLQLNMHIKEMYFGDWEGISTQSIYENEPELLANFWQFPIKYHAPNGESLEQFLQRVQVGFDEIHTQMKIHQWNRALVVTHGGVIKLLTCLARHKHLNDVLKMSAEHGQLYSVKMYKNDSLNFEEIKE